MKFKRLTFLGSSLAMFTAIVGSGYAFFYFQTANYSQEADVAIKQTQALCFGALNAEFESKDLTIDLSRTYLSGIVASVDFSTILTDEDNIYSKCNASFDVKVEMEATDASKGYIGDYIEATNVAFSENEIYTLDGNHQIFATDRSQSVKIATIDVTDISTATDKKYYITPLFNFIQEITTMEDVDNIINVLDNTTIALTFTVNSVTGIE
ncbi:MAG: hypothetical protein WCR67_04180 [Bacilli bacterium]